MSRRFAQDAPINYWAWFFVISVKPNVDFLVWVLSRRTHLLKSNIDVMGSGLVSRTLFWCKSQQNKRERERETPQAFELVKLLLNIQYSLNLIWYNYEFRKTVVRLGNDFFTLDSSRRLTITLINCEIDYHLECEWACWIFGTRNARMRKHVLQLCQVIDSIFMQKLTKRQLFIALTGIHL